MTGVILQARLDSTRLPQKALLDLAGEPVILRVMENLRRVPADVYVLACDKASEPYFAPLAARCGFLCVAGPKEDVLERFCIVVRKTGMQTVLRATGDNPFIFADAASASLERFRALSSGPRPADYFTFSGLPHGSGIEVFSGRRLLEAAALTDSAYEQEHVGPAFYNHADRFVCVRETAPADWYYPSVRTTIDTRDDYNRATVMASYLLSRNHCLPVETRLVLEAWRYASRPVLFVPSIEPGRGTGHIRRLSAAIQSLRPDWYCLLYIPHDGVNVRSVPEDIRDRIVTHLPGRAHLVIVDNFRTSGRQMQELRFVGPVLAIDEGGDGRGLADYLLDVIPGIPGRLCPANRSDSSFLALPATRRRKPVSGIRSALVVGGGENAAGLALPAARMLASLDYEVTAIDPSLTGIRTEENGLTVSGPVAGLRETLCHFDLVVTHYGFTAFEALAAGCRVILFSPTSYHWRLAKANGFSAIRPGKLSPWRFKRIIDRGIRVPGAVSPDTVQHDLSGEFGRIASRSARPCPLCGDASGQAVLSRLPDRTVLRCPECGMTYLSFIVSGPRAYSRSYFFDEYRRQYGKTYLEDFDSIKATGFVRLARVEHVLARSFGKGMPEARCLLDVGCAFGPFLAAARERGWIPYGTDISEDAVTYVRDTLGIQASAGAFPAPSADGVIEGRKYFAVTLWYVIEHFEDLEPVFARIRSLLAAGGVLAFSTPSACGISGRFSRKSFLRDSPLDHCTIWNPRHAQRQLARYGFRVRQIVSTGHHPERFPFMKNAKRDSFSWKVCLAISKAFRLGDTFEVYAIKNGTLEDAE